MAGSVVELIEVMCVYVFLFKLTASQIIIQNNKNIGAPLLGLAKSIYMY